jgi:hypothetical protein
MPTATKAPFAVKDRVIAATDLPRVPAGTDGQVIMVQGLSWVRYWVWFDNGERVGTIHRDKLMSTEEWARRNDAPSTALATTSGAVAAEGGALAAGEFPNVGPVPGLLIERSRLARERWAAKHG